MAGFQLTLYGRFWATPEAEDVFWTFGSVSREYRCEAGRTAKLVIITYPLNDAEYLVFKTRSNKIGKGFIKD